MPSIEIAPTSLATFSPRDAMPTRYMLGPVSVCLPLPASKSRSFTKTTKRGSRKERQTRAHGLHVSCSKEIGEIPMGAPQLGHQYRWARVKSAIFDQCLAVSQVLISHPTEGRRLSWPESLVTYRRTVIDLSTNGTQRRVPLDQTGTSSP